MSECERWDEVMWYDVTRDGDDVDDDDDVDVSDVESMSSASEEAVVEPARRRRRRRTGIYIHKSYHNISSTIL